MIQRIEDQGHLVALVVSNDFAQPGVTFFTEGDLSQQLAYMRHPAGKLIPAHVHNPVHRSVRTTQETLLIKRGKLRVDFYGRQRNYLASRLLTAGDVVLLIDGGHGFEVIEEVEMFEVKQGPYTGDHDKTCFEGVRPAAPISPAPPAS